MPAASRSNYSLAFGPLTRGEEKIYIGVTCEFRSDCLSARNHASIRWKATAKLVGGGEVPAEMAQSPDGDVVAVLPVLTADVDLTVSAFEADGKLCACGHIKITPRNAKYKSRINTLRRNRVASRIRLCDARPTERSLSISDVRLISAGLSAETLQFEVEFFHPGGKEGHARIEADVYLPSGEKRNDIVPIVLGAEDIPAQGYPGFFRCWQCLSLQVPADLGPFFLWVHDADENMDGVIESFHQWRLDSLRRKWIDIASTAEWDAGYHDWFLAHRAKYDELELQRARSERFPELPTFSFIVPLYRTPLTFLSEMASSVLAQTYSKFELILVNSTPDDGALAAAVAELAERDERVKVVTLEGNRGISLNTNAGLSVANGDFVCFFDHDDVLEPDILFWYVKAINDYPETDLLYCDEDKLDQGKYTFPFFKPDWDPYFLETNNYVCHMLTVRRTLLEQIPRLSAELDGAQDHSTVLAAGELARNIYHVRRVLYHWRVHAQSTASTGNVKPESLEAGRIAVQRHFDRLGVDARVAEVRGCPHCYSAEYAVFDSANADVIIYGSSSIATLRQFGERQLGHEGQLFSSVHYLTHMRTDPNFSTKLDDLIRANDADIIALVDCSATPKTPGWARRLASIAQRDGVGVATPRMLYFDGTVAEQGLVCSYRGDAVPLDYLYPSENQRIRGRGVFNHQIQATNTGCFVFDRLAYTRSCGIRDCSAEIWSAALCLALRDVGYAVVIDPCVAFERQMTRKDVLRARSPLDEGWLRGLAELKLKFPAAFSQADPFYNPQLRQDGYYGLE